MGRSKMKIACIFEGDAQSGGGFQTQISTLLLLKKKHEIVVFVFTQENIETIKKYGIQVVLVRNNYFDKALRYLFRIYTFFPIFRKLKIKTIFETILGHHKVDIVYFLSPSFLALDLVEHNYILTVWDLCHRDHPEFPEVNYSREFEKREFFYNQATKKAIAVLVDSETSKNNIINRYCLDPKRVFDVSFIPSVNIISEIECDIKSKYNIEYNYIYYPAQFWAHKNHVYIIDALKKLKDEGLILSAIFSGSDKGNLNYVLEYAKKKEVESQIKYIGFAPNNEIFHLYKQSLALVMPTYFGPTNIPPLEAFSIGTPVIYSDLEGLRDQVGEVALLCDLDNVNSLSNHLSQLMNDPELRNKLTEKGYVRLKELNEKSVVSVLDQIFKDYSIKLNTWKS